MEMDSKTLTEKQEYDNKREERTWEQAHHSDNIDNTNLTEMDWNMIVVL